MSERICVANIIEEGRLGGPQIRIYRVAKELYDHDVETTVIYPKCESDEFNQILTNGNVKNISVPLHHLTKEKKHLLAYFLFFPKEFLFLYCFFKKKRFDIIHCSGGSWQFKGLVTGKLSGSRTIWHLNDTVMPRIFQKLFCFLAPRFADGIIVAGNKVKQYYVDNLKLKDMLLFEIQAPVDTNYFNPRNANYDSQISKYKGLKIITVANIAPNKGIHYFLSMAAQLNKRYQNIHFFIIGSVFSSQKKYFTSLKEQKNNLTLENLHFYGPSASIREVLKAADIFVFPSIAEASPTAVWEAMSMEKAIVSTEVGDVNRFLVNGESGFVVPPQNVEVLTEKVQVLIENPDLRELFGTRARRVAKSFLDIEIIAKEHKNVYSAVMESNGSKNAGK